MDFEIIQMFAHMKDKLFYKGVFCHTYKLYLGINNFGFYFPNFFGDSLTVLNSSIMHYFKETLW